LDLRHVVVERVAATSTGDASWRSPKTESGKSDVDAQAFPGPDEKHRLSAVAGEPATALNVVLGWAGELKRRVTTK
jgi:hypothetical protein